MLNIEPGKKRFIVDVGCGSGLSGAALERAGHEWVGCDVSRDMLRIASEREARADTGELEEDEDESQDESEEELFGYDGIMDDDDEEEEEEAVSYTHLTLPTIYSV